MLTGRQSNPTPPTTHLQEALSWAEQAGENPAYRSDALALQAGLYLERRDYHNAKQASGMATRSKCTCSNPCNPQLAQLDPAGPCQHAAGTKMYFCLNLPGCCLTVHCLTPSRAQVIDKLLEQADSKQETFAKLAMANVHAYSAPYDRRKDGAVQRAEVHYRHALELYRRVLEKDEGASGGGSRAGPKCGNTEEDARKASMLLCLPAACAKQ